MKNLIIVLVIFLSSCAAQEKAPKEVLPSGGKELPKQHIKKTVLC